MKILLSIGKQQNSTVSIIVPTYNESKNIINLLDRINKTPSDVMKTQIIIVDNNSPDGTGTIVDNYKNNIKKFTNNTIKIHRQPKKDLLYTFQNRVIGRSKLDIFTITYYCKSIWRLYRHGKSQNYEDSTYVKFLSKEAQFFTIGASGFGISYLVSIFFTLEAFSSWYIHANIISIMFSMTSNFVLNKIWTFEDRDFGLKKTITQYAKFVGLSTFGAAIQLGTVYYLLEEHNLDYSISLLLAVTLAVFANFILNKKLTFKGKLWS